MLSLMGRVEGLGRSAEPLRQHNMTSEDSGYVTGTKRKRIPRTRVEKTASNGLFRLIPRYVGELRSTG